MPNSPLVRWTVRLVAAALVAALAALLALRIYGSERLAAAEKEFAAKVGSREAAPSAPVRFLDEENAALLLRGGAEAMILPGDDKPLVGEASMTPSHSWSESQRADIRRILGNNRPAVELLHRAAGKASCNFGVIGSNNKTEELTGAHLLKLMTAQRLLLVDARMALLERDAARLLADAASMSTMAAGFERETPMIELVAGIACERMLLSVVGETIADPSTARGSLSSLQEMLVDTDLRVAWRRSNLAEAAEIERHVAVVMSDPLTAREGKASLYGRILEFAIGDIFRAQQLELRADLVAAVDQPLGLNPQLLARGSDRPRWMFDVFESVIFPEGAKAAARVQSTLSARNLAGFALALRLRAFETGSYPSTLAGLAGATQPDPFAGKPLAYDRRPDGSARITVPGFEGLWRRISGAGAGSQPFSCELPTPQPPAARGAVR
ncbi:MAG: hypothetical protein A2Y78_07790 [Acidobacteria bacterium RBG_13_68_16]|nr:MAG: hypothetical protein A2Y78_07790 [Acidobacteria bacterium RBG_13_68_16]